MPATLFPACRLIQPRGFGPKGCRVRGWRSAAVAAAVIALGGLPGEARAVGDAASPLVLVDATLVDPARMLDQPGMTVVVEAGRIRAIFPNGERPLSPGAEVHDLGGRYLLPGLIEAHTHLTPMFRQSRETMYRELERMLYGGVVAARDMAGDARVVGEAMRSALAGERLAPDIHSAVVLGGPHFAATDRRMAGAALGHRPGSVAWAQEVTAEIDLRLAVARAVGTGARALKLYLELDAELIGELTAEARRQGLRVWAHSTVFPARPIEVVRAGVDVISHACGLAWQDSSLDPAAFTEINIDRRPAFDPARVEPDSPEMTELFAEMTRRGTVLDLTLSNHGRPGDDGYGCTPELTVALARAAHRAGVMLAAGTDYAAPAEDPYPSLHLEIEYLVDKGVLTPQEALVAATLNGARALGLESDFGTLEEGKVGSFVILEENPLRDVQALRTAVAVVQRGRLHARADYEASRQNDKAPLTVAQRSAVAAAVEKALHAEQRAFGARDCDAALAFFAEGDRHPLFVVNGRTAPHKGALRGACAAMVENRTPGRPRQIEEEQVYALGLDAAYTVTRYSMPIALPDGTSATLPQLVTKIWGRSDGEWRIVHFHESTALPPTGTAARP